MAYFSNGTEGLAYREQYCSRCEHLPEEEDRDCPIWTAHLFYCADSCREPKLREVLNLLIPMKPHTFKDGLTCEFPAECAFFRHRTERLPFEQPPAVNAVDPAVTREP